MAGWITAICAVIALLGAAVYQWSRVKQDVAALRVRVDSMDRELATMARSQLHLETLITTVLANMGLPPRTEEGDV